MEKMKSYYLRNNEGTVVAASDNLAEIASVFELRLRDGQKGDAIIDVLTGEAMEALTHAIRTGNRADKPAPKRSPWIERVPLIVALLMSDDGSGKRAAIADLVEMAKLADNAQR